MTKHYTDLHGAVGERIQFGPPDYRAKELFFGTPPKVRIGLHLCDLESLGALRFTVSSKSAFDNDGPDPSEAVFLQGETEIARHAILGPVAADRGKFHCNLFDRALDIEGLVKANGRALAVASRPVPSKPREDVPTSYKIFCADTLDILGTMRRQVEEEIGPYEAHLTPEERATIDDEIEASINTQWLDFLHRANREVLPYKYDDAARAKMKRYTENVVTREMCLGALQHRCYHKPLGYPGDFEIMNALYDDVPRGETTYARLLDRLAMIAGRPVTARMNRMTAELSQMIDENPDREHFHVMSIGAGPAREFRRLFELGLDRGKGFTITLVDPEEAALRNAFSNIYGSIKTGVSSVMVNGMNTSFTEMLRPSSTFRHLPPQDLVYSAGLTDYLNERLTRSFVKKLFAYIRPGGRVIVGNVNDNDYGMYWSTEYVTDWTMFFRNRQEMDRIAEGLPGNPEISTDDSGSYFMLQMTKS